MVSFKVYYEANIANAEDVKLEIIDLLQKASRRKPNLEPGGPIYKWFTTSLIKFLTGPAPNVSYPFQQSLIGLEPHKYKEGEPEWMKKDDVVDFTDTYDSPKMQHIMDYFNSLSDRDREKIVKKPYEQVDKEVADWDKELAEQEASSLNKLKEGTDYEVLYKDGDYTWVKLSTKEAYECEGAGMGHCVGGYDPNDSENTIISLWDKKGQPHVTIEMAHYPGFQGAGSQKFEDTPPGQRGDLDEIVQIKGKQNHPPVGKYKEITAKFVKKWLDEGEFYEQAKSLEELEPSRDVVGDGKGIGMFRWEGADGAWHWYFEDSKVWKMIYKLSVLPQQQDRIQDIKKRMFDDPSAGLLIDADANLSHSFFKEIPKELANVRGVTDGDFNVQDNRLTSLKNSPLDIEGSFYAGRNELETLEGAPSVVDGSFFVNNNYLKNLKGLPEHISGDLHINMNPLESLEGAEKTVVGGTVFIGGWPMHFPADHPRHMKPDKVIDAFKHIGKGKAKGPVHAGRWREQEGEVQVVPPGVRAYPDPPHPGSFRMVDGERVPLRARDELAGQEVHDPRIMIQ